MMRSQSWSAAEPMMKGPALGRGSPNMPISWPYPWRMRTEGATWMRAQASVLQTWGRQAELG